MRLRANALCGVSLCSALLGCGGVPIPAIDAGVPDGGDAVACTVGPLPSMISTGEGGRVIVPLAPTGPKVTVEVTQAPQDFRASVDGATNKLTVRAPYATDGMFTISLAAHCGSQSATADLPVQLHRATWSTVASWSPSVSAPAARQFPGLWIDSSTPDRMLLFGGDLFMPSQGTVTNDLWSLDLTTGQWSAQQSSDTGPVQGAGRLAPVPGAPAVILQGGQDSGGHVLDAMWRLDLGDPLNWTAVNPANGAGAGRLLGAFVYDAPRNRYLSVFGYSNDDLSDQVMQFSPDAQGGGTWTALETAADQGARPAPRYSFSYALDAETDRLFVFSGGQAPTAQDPVNAAADLWALELGESPPRWVQLTSPGVSPAGRRNACFAFDSVGHRLVVWGGTDDAATVITDMFVLELDRGAEQWHVITAPNPAPGRSSAAAVFDAARDRVLFGFGNSKTAIFTDVWALNL